MGGGVNYANREGVTPLHKACGPFGNLETVSFLIDKGADICAKNDYGKTPLYWACAYGNNLEIVSYLINKGAEVNLKTKLGTPLHEASSQGKLEMVSLLIEQGANVAIKDKQGKTPLEVAYNLETAALFKGSVFGPKIFKKAA